jgi:hypothetical protein
MVPKKANAQRKPPPFARWRTSFMDERIQQKFPPTLIVGNRVWAENGYQNHGPQEGPKVEVGPKQGGVITGVRERNQFVTGYVLYAVRWDNGEVSEHYANELVCIGHFQKHADFEAAINPTGAVTLTLGPNGGIRMACLELEYDGQRQTAEASRKIWLEYIEPKVRKKGLRVSTLKLKKGE